MKELRSSSTELASYLEISQPAISKASKRGADYSHLHELEFENIIMMDEISY